MYPLIPRMVIMLTAATIVMISKRMDSNFATIGLSNAANPMHRPMLAMLLPMTLPRIMSGVDVLTIDVTASGADEPNARTVIPTTKGAMPKRRASFFAPSTSQSEPK